uniref:AAA+ ATPase domain-containing protein n=1 Tax=Quercus lobata TaxID=97700 RepID=A0A7N2MWE5_QUELO
MPISLTTLFSVYASISAFVMLARSMVNEHVPPEFRSYLFSIFQHYFFTPQSAQLTLIIEENCGIVTNQIYEAATIYLRNKISDSTKRLKVSKTIRQKKSTIEVVTGEEITDCFENIKLKWKFPEKARRESSCSETIKEEQKEVRLYSHDCLGCDDEGYSGWGGWGSINLEHPVTFEKLAMDPEVKKMLKDDLDRFVRRKELYKKVGKPWKRGYLLYGPPGTGKSSLIAAMANYLKFNIYDLNLSSIHSDSELRRIFLSTSNRSILVIEDIDCSAELEDREEEDNFKNSSSKFTLSGLLNSVDGLWSSCGDERIIVFTTNHKDRLDPALLRPGRMDMHVHMSYCTMDGFKLLASNYLGINGDHRLFKEIEGLLENAEVTPAEIAEELLKSDGNDVALEGLVKFLEQKRPEDANSLV